MMTPPGFSTKSRRSRSGGARCSQESRIPVRGSDRRDAFRLLAVIIVASAFAVTAVFAQQPQTTSSSPDAEIPRIRGIIDQDQTWSGAVVITDDVTIQDATVTVQPGTTIEFAKAAAGVHPTLTVGSSASSIGDLKILGTAQQPVTFRTHEGTNAGRIVVNVRSRIVGGEIKRGELPPASQPTAVPSDVAWRHVRLESLGFARPKHGEHVKAQVVEPALTFNLLGAPHSLDVSECTFAKCARLEIRAGDGAKVIVSGNRFASETERIALEVFADEGAAPVGSLAVAGNVMSAALSVSGAAATVADNLLVGIDASIVVKDDASTEARIAGNYVHNTTEEDEGKYDLNCENPNALVENNIFRGGTTCVLNGSRRMTGNVFIGASRLASKLVRNARTHQLVGALPADSTFERNLLLGPAYSLLVPQPGGLSADGRAGKGPTIIRHNVFDGFSESGRAIHLNAAGRASSFVAVLNNVFLRVPTLVFDEGKTDNTLTYADHNAVAPAPERPFDQVQMSGIKAGSPGWGARDVRAADLAGLRLVAVPKEPPGDFDAELLTKKATVAQVRRRLFDAYRPLADSPLVNAGRGADAQADGAAPGPTIGPGEPAGRN